jgi:hypothetical protein
MMLRIAQLLLRMAAFYYDGFFPFGCTGFLRLVRATTAPITMIKTTIPIAAYVKVLEDDDDVLDEDELVRAEV